MMFATHVVMRSTIKWEDGKGVHNFHPEFTLIMVGGEHVGTIAVADRVYVQPPSQIDEPIYLGHTMSWVDAVGALISFIRIYAEEAYDAIAPFVWAEVIEGLISKEYVYDGEYPLEWEK